MNFQFVKDHFNIDEILFHRDYNQLMNIILHVVFIVISAAYCIYLAKHVETPANNRVDMQTGSAPGPRES